jgi:hypothetical protein
MKQLDLFLLTLLMSLFFVSCSSHGDLARATKKQPSSDSATVNVIDYELRMRPAKVGDKKTISFNLKLTGVKSAAVEVTGFDIDGVTEADLLINGQNIKLPADIVADMKPKTVTIELDKGILKEGRNHLTFIFADAVGGTTGYSITSAKILLRKSEFRTVNVIDSELKLKPARVGDKKTVQFDLNLENAKSAAIQVTGLDIDGITEAEMFINGRQVQLTPEIVADMMPKTVTMELDNGILKEGKNAITFRFADAVGGTNGYTIPKVKIFLRQ